MDLKQTLLVARLLDCYGNLLTNRQKQIVQSYIDYDASLSEIAENFSISRQAVQDILKQAIEKLELFEQKLCFLEKIDLAKKNLLGIKGLTKQQQKCIIEIIETLED